MPYGHILVPLRVPLLICRLLIFRNLLLQVYTSVHFRFFFCSFNSYWDLLSWWTNYSFCSCVMTVWLGVRTSRIFIFGWFLGGDSVFSSAIYFCLLNTISNLWSSLYDLLRAIVLYYCPWLVPVSETSSHYRCCYLMLDPLRLVNVANHIDLTQTKGFYNPCKFSGYPVSTSTVFNGVYTKQGKVD